MKTLVRSALAVASMALAVLASAPDASITVNEQGEPRP